MRNILIARMEIMQELTGHGDEAKIYLILAIKMGLSLSRSMTAILEFTPKHTKIAK